MRVAVSPPASDSSASLSHRELARNEGANVESSSDCGAGIFIGCSDVGVDTLTLTIPPPCPLLPPEIS